MSYDYLCDSCCYPIFHSATTPLTLYSIKYGRVLFAASFKDEILKYIPLEDFLGFKSYVYDKALVDTLRKTKSRLGTKKIGYSVFTFNTMLEEISFSASTKDNSWKQFIREYYADKLAAKEVVEEVEVLDALSV